MEYGIRITRPAQRDITRAALWYSEEAAGLGEKWADGVYAAIDSLDTNPDRCGIAHETDELDFELRELLYGVGPNKTHRILFRVVEQTVEILAVRHVAQQNFTSDDVS